MLLSGRTTVTTAGTAVVLGGQGAMSMVLITAETNNTGVIAVGSSTVVASEATRTGTPLFAGESVQIEVPSLTEVYIDSTVSTDGVTYNAI